MKLQIIFQNSFYKKGFLTAEIMLAFSLFILFTISTFTLLASMQRLKTLSLKELDKMKDFVYKMDNSIDLAIVQYGNDSQVLSNYLFTLSKSDYVESWGRNSCNSRINFDQNKIKYFPNGIDMGISNASTDIEVRNGIVYLTADSATLSKPDFFIINAKNPANPVIISSLNTGPGISAIEIAGPYAFMAQASTVNQIQIIDIHNRNAPQLISQIKLPTPTPTTTAPFATSIFYSKGYVYLGTVKWVGAEFSIIDISNIHSPVVVGQFETNTLINDIYVRGNKAYLASSDEKQIRILDVSNKSNPILIDYFSPTGWQTQEGKTLDFFEGHVGFGRTVGGFNVIANHEAFIFSTTTYISSDTAGGVYGMLLRPSFNFLLTHQGGKEFQVFDSTLKNKLFDMPLGSQPVKMACDGDKIFFATGNGLGLSILELGE